jgi:glyoxylase-like metal-dependent hydrolase (beta-lactamase superfamily II)
LVHRRSRQFTADAADYRQACHGSTPCGRRRVSRLASNIKPRPDVAAIGQVDALCLTHSHVDHAAALDSWAGIGARCVR